MATTEEMDRMYRLQRYFYDFTRKYYLLGRDRLLREMDLAPGARVLEIGCGTARNLGLLARGRPDVMYYGIDASHEMLMTAEARIVRARLEERGAAVSGGTSDGRGLWPSPSWSPWAHAPARRCARPWR